MQTKLYRSRTNRMICGICGGLGEYLRIDPVIIRIVVVLMALGHGAGVLIYLILCVVMPEEPAGDEVVPTVDASRNRMLAGMILILIGAVVLGHNLNIVVLRWLNGDLVWPLLLIAGGILLLRRRFLAPGTAPDKGA
jgi:phage shock protein C